MRRRKTEGRPTLADVAAKAGVSPITVSRTLADPKRVSPHLRRQVEEAVAALQYVPNLHARALASAFTPVIGVIVPSLTNNVFSDVLKGIYKGIAESDYQVQMANSHYSPLEEERLLATFVRQRPAGLIVTGIDQSEASKDLLRHVGCPVVQIMDLSDCPIDMMVGFSHEAGAQVVTRHLVEAGYSRIGFLGARMDPRTQRRLDGYRSALRDAGLFDPERITVTRAPSSVSLGRDLLRDLLARKPETDAVFCINDDLALGVLFECQSSAVSVPEQFGIAGFNDFEMMSASFPSITSLRTRRYEIGLRAANMVRAAIDGNRSTEKIVNIGFELQIRNSTRKHSF